MKKRPSFSLQVSDKKLRLIKLLRIFFIWPNVHNVTVDSLSCSFTIHKSFYICYTGLEINLNPSTCKYIITVKKLI